MAPVTELISISLKPDLPSAEATSVVDATAATLIEQPGCLRVRKSRLHEDSNEVRFFADWVDVAAHRTFEKTEVYPPFRARVVGAVSTPPQRPYHANFEPYPPTVLNNTGPDSKTPVAEVIHIWFPADHPEDARQRASASAREFAHKLAQFAEGMTGETALGWSVENDIDHDGAPSSVLISILGWVSVEAHMKARDHPEFPKIIPLLRDLEGLKGIEITHVTTTTVEPAK
ncbi:hypothetical protein F5Y11DRAFT_74197 [Daldinia sp. FL1419]|nr:hypothetical protein F5Y11DRAFT_74197 [Daldinia sp. FL1419]